MKKKLITLTMLIFVFFIYGIEVNANTDNYQTFVEIMMNEGKLLKNFTEEEYDAMIDKIKNHKFAGVSIYIENNNIDASYISNTLYSVENNGSTDVTYDIEITVETNNKISFNASESLSAQASGTVSKIKGDIGAKCGAEFSTQTTTSRKEKQTMKLVVEKHSRAIIYLTGNLSISNGVAAYDFLWIRVCQGGWEIVKLKNQYSRIEKASIL